MLRSDLNIVQGAYITCMATNDQEGYFHFEKNNPEPACTLLDSQGQFLTYLGHLLLGMALCENNRTGSLWLLQLQTTLTLK